MTMSPGCERRHEELLDIGAEALAVDRPVEDAGRIDAVVAQAARKVSVRQRPCGALATSRWPRGAQPLQRRHVGLGPGLVDEDEPRRDQAGPDAPSSAGARRATSGRSCSLASSVFFEAQPCRVHDPPDRAIARSPRRARQFRHQAPQRHVRRRREPRQQPLPLRRQRIAPPPPIGFAAALPVARKRCDHFTTLATLTWKVLATSRQLAPPRPPPQPRVHEDQANRVSPSMLAPIPASILNQKCPRVGNPKSDSVRINPTLAHIGMPSARGKPSDTIGKSARIASFTKSDRKNGAIPAKIVFKGMSGAMPCRI